MLAAFDIGETFASIRFYDIDGKFILEMFLYYVYVSYGPGGIGSFLSDPPKA